MFFRTYYKAGRPRVRFPMVSVKIFYWHNTFGHTVALELTQPLTEMNIRSASWGLMAAGA